MVSDRLVHIVRGYHQDTPISDFTIQHHLGNRFAIIFDPFQSNLEEEDFDVEFMIAILNAISNTVDYDRFLAEFDDNTQCISFNDVCNRLRAMSDVNNQVPQRIFYWKRNSCVCIEETEFWALCGGPAPYHDSYTFSFYVRDDLSESFEAACAIACQQVDGRIGNIIQASAHPIKRSFCKRVFQKLF